jgi:hypothetical protein
MARPTAFSITGSSPFLPRVIVIAVSKRWRASLNLFSSKSTWPLPTCSKRSISTCHQGLIIYRFCTGNIIHFNMSLTQPVNSINTVRFAATNFSKCFSHFYIVQRKRSLTPSCTTVHVSNKQIRGRAIVNAIKVFFIFSFTLSVVNITTLFLFPKPCRPDAKIFLSRHQEGFFKD